MLVIINKLNTKAKEEQNAELIYTASDSMMQTLADAGVEYFFVGLGSDHASLIESWASSKVKGKKMPKIIICPHEFLTLTMAHGFAQATGRAQAVFVHVDVGTQNMGGSIHNAMRGRVPVLIFAGMSPATAEGELLGSRNEFIHYLQDVNDQSGVLRQYMKYTQTIYSGKNADKIINRALQLAESEPKGPTYIMSPREVLAESVDEPIINHEEFTRLTSSALDNSLVNELTEELRKAEKPMIITSYLGRHEESVQELVKLAEKYAIPIIESGPYYVNFPTTHPLHLGYEDYTGNNESIDMLKESDFVLVLDCDVPWMPMQVKPDKNTKVYWIDIDPLKEDIPTWYYPATKRVKACSLKALKQLNKKAEELEFTEEEKATYENRYDCLHKKHESLRKATYEKSKVKSHDGYITPDYLTSVVQEVTEQEEVVFVNEAISNFGIVWRNIEREKANTFYGSGASSLGWHGGAALGIKLANPDKHVVALTGDGTYMFSIPSSTHWISSRYKLPFLTIIYNNRGWKSPKLSTLGVHPEGIAKNNEMFWTDFGEITKYEKVAEASGGALGLVAKDPDTLRDVIQEGFNAVKNGRSAVINVYLEPASEAVED